MTIIAFGHIVFVPNLLVFTKRSQKWQRGRQRTPSCMHYAILRETRHDSTSQLNTENQTKPKTKRTSIFYHSNPKNTLNNLFSFLESRDQNIYIKKKTLSNFSLIRYITSNPHDSSCQTHKPTGLESKSETFFFLGGTDIVWRWAAIDEMGYAMSRLEIEPDHCDSGEVVHVVGDSQRSNKPLNDLDNEIAQLTKLKSGPHQMLSQIAPGRRGLPVSTVKMLAGRECNFSGRGRFSSADCCHVLSRYLPVNGPWLIDEMNSRAYVSQFSADGSLFVAGFQGSHIRIYNVDKGWKVQKNILAKSLRWTITDTSLSPDQRHLVYASMSPIVHIVNVGSAETESLANVTEIHDGLDFSSAGDEDRGYSFGIFSVKFSTDGREVVAGSSDDSIYVYDLEANKPSLQISAHSSDVNTVCFADESGHLIYSGSDDTYCKVWDRRCLNARDKPAGVLMGHLEGITFIDSRGDGRYFISNGKDQSIKLWDIRKMSSEATCNREDFRKYEWDYRWMDYPPQAKDVKHPRDLSVATYRGHSVLRTLIRCYFSPEYSTGQKYIYTGSHNSCVYIYDLVSGAQVATLKHHKSPVRDCSWHPYYPMLLSSSWDGDIVKWEFPGSGEAPAPVNKKRVPMRYIY